MIDGDFPSFPPEGLSLVNGDSRRGYVVDAPTKVKFSHQFPRRGKLIPKDFLRDYEPFCAKLNYLAERFRTTIRTQPVCLVRRGISRQQAVRLERKMRRGFPSADMTFLYVNSDRETFETPLGRSVFLPEPTTGLGDSLAWARLLVELGLVERPFRLATSQIVRGADDYHLDSRAWYSMRALREARLQNPENPWFVYEMGLCCLAQRRYGRAEKLALEALASDRDNYDFLELLMRSRTGRPRSRKAALAELLPQIARSDHLGLHDVAIDALIREGRLDEAGTLLDRISCVHPHSPTLLSQRALILLALGQTRDALAAIDTALTWHPNGKALVDVKARILKKTGRSEEALRIVGDALRESESLHLRLRQAELACRVVLKNASLGFGRGRTA